VAETTTSADTRTSTGTLSEVYLAMVWLVTTLYTAHLSITGNTDDLSGLLGSAAASLPGLVAAALVTGASIGSAASGRFNSAGGRLMAGLALGALFGAVAAAGIRLAYGGESAIMVLAITVGAASLVGGALAVLPGEVLEAGLWSTTFVFMFGVFFGIWQPNVTKMLGGGPDADAAAQATADTRYFYIQAGATGLLAGVYALRAVKAERYAWLISAAAGALPGLILLGAEWLTRLGGHNLATVMNDFQQPADDNPLRLALFVTAIGAFVALLAGLRTSLRRPEPEPADSDDDEDD
jgi:hypothetical protein